MKKGKKYVLQKVAKYTGTIVLSTLLLAYPSSSTYATIEYTSEDLINNAYYESTLSTIKEETPVFHNIDLYNELTNQGILLTKNNLSNITELSILNHLSNPDLSDLKYFPNLTKLTITNNYINCDDIKYNANLLDLTISNSDIENTSSLPNSIYNITLDSCIINDDIFNIPYNTKYITTINTSFNNIYLKNPTFLNRLTIKGNTFLDISSLIECTNLEYLQLKRVPNVSNSHLLPNLNIKELILDDYASIWLSSDTYQLLNLDNYNILNQINELDQIAHNISINSSNKEDIINNITKYILETLEYDKEITNEELDTYNDSPIYTSFNEENAICINYASLFTALCNRLDIETYQIYSNSHTWNMIEDDNNIRFIDLTQLDTKTVVRVLENNSLLELQDTTSLDYLNNNTGHLLYHYNMSLGDILKDESLSNYNLLPLKSNIDNIDIGYINNECVVLEYNKKLYILDRDKLYLTLIVLSTLLAFAPSISKKLSK